MSEESAAPLVPNEVSEEANAAVGDVDGVKASGDSASGDSDGEDEGDDDEDFEPNAPRRKRPKKSAEDNRGGGSDDEGITEGNLATTEGTAVAASSSTAEQQQQPSGPTVSGGSIDFPLAPVQSRLICNLCMGYFRDPYTITECLHTFCKSCLFFAFRSGFRRCPECETSLEPDPFKEILADRTMQTLVDKMFPHLKEEDDMDEREFYKRRGIKIKREFQGETERSKKEVPPVDDDQSRSREEKVEKDVPDDELEFVIVPDENVERDFQMPPLQKPTLRSSGRLKVMSLKRYILKRLQIKASPASVSQYSC